MKLAELIKNMNIIGTGTFGHVYSVDSEHVVVKHNKVLMDQAENEHLLKKMKSEFLIMAKNFNNILKSFEYHMDDKNKKFYYTMEKMRCNLRDYIKELKVKRKKDISYEEFEPILKGIITGEKIKPRFSKKVLIYFPNKGLFALKEREGLVHRDLKPTNIMMNQKGDPFISDFGECKMLSLYFTDTLNDIPSWPWTAPEFLSLRNSDSFPELNKDDYPKTDIFSLGLIILYCLDPSGFNLGDNYKNTEKEKLEKYLESFQKNVKLPSDIFNLLKRMVSFKPEDRPSIYDLKDMIVPEVSFNRLGLR